MKKGFTLIEFLVVIAIICILTAIMYPVFYQARYHHAMGAQSSGQYHIVSDQYVGGNHIQIMEDNKTHIKYQIINNKAVGQVP